MSAPITIDELISSFDPEQLTEIFRVCADRHQHCNDLHTTLQAIDTMQIPWQGDAATAAKNAVGKTRKDLTDHGDEVWKVGAAANDCYADAVAVKDRAKKCESEAHGHGWVIDSGNKVTDPHPPDTSDWSPEDVQKYKDDMETLQHEVDSTIEAANRLDDDLAALFNVADGELPDTPRGEASNVNEAGRKANEVAAFKQLYGRTPTSDNDWRIAQALDPHTYDPKYRGAKSTVQVARINPQPGHGVVRANFYIPGEDVQNVSLNPLDLISGHTLPHNLGDNRGPDSNASPEHSRVSAFVDYNNGSVIVRQNPTVVSDYSKAPEAGVPTVHVAQTADGTVRMQYSATDTFESWAAKQAGVAVAGDLTVQPQQDGPANVGGKITTFPAAEVYNYGDDGAVTPIADYRATGSDLGPMRWLWMGANHDIGGDVPQVGASDQASPQVGYPGSQQSSAARVGTELGSADNPPTAPIVPARR
ncbi:hypothetical protein AAFP30_05720 [Gordonia sp. CPCC 205515]|uniref:hypothetical protein n=1 Tax=Gordonia sp. CPCC 205515 TaxID=3140791 RepID=UPI003AF3FB31